MNSYFLEFFIYSGTGFVFSRLLADVLVLLLLLHFIREVALPVIKNYRLALYLDRICGSERRHWLYGHLLKYTLDEKGMRAMIERSWRFPYICNSWVGPILTQVMVHHPESIKAVLSSNIPKTDMLYRFMRPWIGDGLLTSYGKKWQRNRRLLTPAFHYNVLKSYVKVYNRCAKVFLDNLKSDVGNPVEVTSNLRLMTLDVILQCTMSFETDCQNTKGKHPYIVAMREMGEITMYRWEHPIMTIDWIFNVFSLGKRLKKAVKVAHGQAKKVIAQRRNVLDDAQQKDTNDEKKRLDFLDILLETKDEDGKGLTDDEIRDEVNTFLFAGHDTTSSALSWMFYNLAKHPDIQEKCREEVVPLLQKREEVEWSDLSQLQYLTMFIKESLRLNPPVPAVGRNLNKALDIADSSSSNVTIPTNVNVGPLIFVVHRHPDIWEHPERFDPDRFTLENISKRPVHSFIPFSAGPRNCIGQNFAMNEIKVVLCRLLKRYRLYLDSETPPPIIKLKIVMESENGVFIKFAELK